MDDEGERLDLDPDPLDVLSSDSGDFNPGEVFILTAELSLVYDDVITDQSDMVPSMFPEL